MTALPEARPPSKSGLDLVLLELMSNALWRALSIQEHCIPVAPGVLKRRDTDMDGTGKTAGAAATMDRIVGRRGQAGTAPCVAPQQDSLSELDYSSARSGLVRDARAMFPSLSEASLDDVVNSVFADFWSQRDGFRYQGERSLRAWLAIRLRWKVLDRKRRSRRHPEMPFDESRRPVSTESSSYRSPSRILLRKQEMERLQRSMSMLPAMDQQILVLRFQGQTAAVIAGMLGISEEAAKKRFQRALGRLRVLMVE